jgi:putative tricarboxylic transport membrane protein
VTEISLQSERRPNWAALIVAVVLLASAALVIVDAVRLGGTAQYARIGPAIFAYVVGIFLVALAIWTVAEAFQNKFPRWDVPELAPVAWIACGMIAQMLLLRHVGFSVATGVLFAMTARGFGRKPLWLGLVVGIPFAFLVWIVFARLLMLSLPAGPLERLIP